jgi:fibronectin-binding autotransporter adhesin
MRRLWIVAPLLLVSIRAANAQTWQVATGSSSWNTAANWNPATVPNSVGATATFNNATSANNPAQTGNRTANLDGAKTVGSLVFNADAANAFTNTIATGTGGALTFDATASGPATLISNGPGTGNNTISVAMVLNDDLVATANQQNTASTAFSLNLTGTMSGAGGFTKAGDGGATFGTGTKTYTGATTINGGRIRISSAARPTGTSSFTVNNGGQVDPISDGGTYTFGATSNVVVNLNGAGPTTGQFSVFPGAIRQDTNTVVTITNKINLQSNTTIHVQGASTGSLTLSNAISGVGKLTFTAPNSNTDIGKLVINGANTYSGGTLVGGGTLVVSGSTATLGTGDVEVNNAASGGLATSVLQILAGVSNAIDDNAKLTLMGGSAGAANLGSGIDDLIGNLVLGGVTQSAPGTYGSTTSGAMFQNNTYFSGTGVVRLAVAVPEASSFLFVGLAAVAAFFGRHFFAQENTKP